jgi:soluble lytic murein transglycosylase
VLLSIAAAQEQQGLDDDAATTYKLLWYAHPATDEARIATHRLDILEEFLGESQRDGSTWRRRGDRLFRKRDNEGALQAYDTAIDLGLSASELRRAQRQRAQALFRMRNYPEAVKAFSALSQQDDVPIWRARSLARAGEVPRAIDEFERMAGSKRNANGVRARYLAALLLDGRGFVERADAHYRAVAQQSASTSMGHAAAWRLGWTHYKQGQWAEAIDFFDGLIHSKRKEPIDQLRSRYWRARALEKMGDLEAAAEFRVIAQEYPFSYYGWRALDRAGDPVERSVAPDEPATGKHRIDPRALERARILLAAGFESQASDELGQLVRRARGLDERLELAGLLSEAGDYHRAQRLIVDPYVETLARGPQRRLEELWWYAWPPAYSNLVHDATSEAGSVPPELVYAVMREESGYRAKIVSPVGARGLLQIMIPTGERLARVTGLQSFSADDLFEPRTNIGLGSHYLGELGAHFPGRLSASIASYNAGPDSVREWAPEAATDDDEWVEAIPYDQTRSYVKRVLRSLHAYRVLY